MGFEVGKKFWIAATAVIVVVTVVRGGAQRFCMR